MVSREGLLVICPRFPKGARLWVLCWVSFPSAVMDACHLEERLTEPWAVFARPHIPQLLEYLLPVYLHTEERL